MRFAGYCTLLCKIASSVVNRSRPRLAGPMVCSGKMRAQVLTDRPSILAATFSGTLFGSTPGGSVVMPESSRSNDFTHRSPPAQTASRPPAMNRQMSV